MSLWQMFLEADATYQCIAELGELGLVEFRDVIHFNSIKSAASDDI